VTEKSLFAGFGGAHESTRTGERVSGDNGNMACPPENVSVKKESKGGKNK
jgi:hypothetical protein